MSALEFIPRADTVAEVVGLAVGGGSTCWESMNGTGTFQDRDAMAIVDAAVARISELEGRLRSVTPASTERDVVEVTLA